MLKPNSNRVKTSLSLSKTKPLKQNRIKQLQRTIKEKAQKKASEDRQAGVRKKPASKLAHQEKIRLWFIPARIAYFLNGIYFLSFAIIAFIGIFSNFSVIKPFFTLPFETSFSSFFLLEIAAGFSFLVSLVFFHAARHPAQCRWFYFVLILVFFPYHFVSNAQKMQIELSQDFLNYLYFDTIVMAIFWICYLASLYPYLKHKTQL